MIQRHTWFLKAVAVRGAVFAGGKLFQVFAALYVKERCEADRLNLGRCKSPRLDLRVCLEDTSARRTNTARIAAGISGLLSAFSAYSDL